jgi:hypothetical protein
MRDVCPSAASQLIRSSSSAIAHTYAASGRPLMPRWRRELPASRHAGDLAAPVDSLQLLAPAPGDGARAAAPDWRARVHASRTIDSFVAKLQRAPGGVRSWGPSHVALLPHQPALTGTREKRGAPDCTGVRCSSMTVS